MEDITNSEHVFCAILLYYHDLYEGGSLVINTKDGISRLLNKIASGKY